MDSHLLQLHIDRALAERKRARDRAWHQSRIPAIVTARGLSDATCADILRRVLLEVAEVDDLAGTLTTLIQAKAAAGE